jgi:hypothetical protein
MDALLFLRALRMFMAPLLSVLLTIVLILPLLLSMLGPIVLVLPLLLLSVLLRLLSMLLGGFGLLVLTLLLLGVVLLFALLLVLCVSRSSDSEKQRQDGFAGEANCVHTCYLCSFQCLPLL